MPGLAPAEAKTTIRQRIREARMGLSPSERARAGAELAGVVLEIPQVRAARRVAAYASMSLEPGTLPLIQILHAHGTVVLLPIVLPHGVLDWAEYDGHLTAVPGLGGPEPTGMRLGPGQIADADVVLVPALAVDTLGRRLGQGGGYYDRALPIADPLAPVIALLYEGEIFDAAVEPIPSEPHDCLVDAIATPRRYLPLHPGAGLSSWLAAPSGAPRG